MAQTRNESLEIPQNSTHTQLKAIVERMRIFLNGHLQKCFAIKHALGCSKQELSLCMAGAHISLSDDTFTLIYAELMTTIPLGKKISLSLIENI